MPNAIQLPALDPRIAMLAAILKQNGVQVVGVAGKSSSGKDRLVETYLDQLGFIPIAFADPVKEEVVARGMADYSDVYHHKTNGRAAMQFVGDTLGRQSQGEGWWVIKTLVRMIRTAERLGVRKFAVTDVRRLNEFLAVRAMGGINLLVFAPDRVDASEMAPSHRTHGSEIELDVFYPRFNAEGAVFFQTAQFADGTGPEMLWDGVIDNQEHNADTMDTQVAMILRIHDVIAPNQTFRDGVLTTVGEMVTDVDFREEARRRTSLEMADSALDDIVVGVDLASGDDWGTTTTVMGNVLPVLPSMDALMDQVEIANQQEFNADGSCNDPRCGCQQNFDVEAAPGENVLILNDSVCGPDAYDTPPVDPGVTEVPPETFAQPDPTPSYEPPTYEPPTYEAPTYDPPASDTSSTYDSGSSSYDSGSSSSYDSGSSDSGWSSGGGDSGSW